ncbi:pentapeptide repeat-containing protein [Micromonospora palomenae]|uniref:pentapeptide repeat-containing protein n=1 Tax=Micromonospora palomenae TaxID=1461247 RepID=UPI003F89DDD3
MGAVACVGITALAVMLLVADDASGADRAKLQIEAIKYGVGAIAAGGAAAALLLAVRRQRFSEHIHEHTVSDAAERRVTELYTKAVEQLGSSDAAVRLGGLYALERLAQNNPDQRQTIVNVLCAYLRMPYLPPAVPAANATAAGKPLTELPLISSIHTSDIARDARQELQVRLTAQGILTSHLSLLAGIDQQHKAALAQNSDQPFWLDIDLDLTGAVLVDWNLERGRLRRAVFSQATFSGDARFDKATFAGDASFSEATFTGDASFSEATFTGDASFSEATFTGDASFSEATFTGDASFSEATFTGDASFSEATFTGDASFNQATFRLSASFGNATFTGDASFNEATFTGSTHFEAVTFTRTASFHRSAFGPATRFTMATFGRSARFEEANFTGDALFNQASFGRESSFSNATFTGDASFNRATFRLRTQFSNATFSGIGWFKEATFRYEVSFHETTFTGPVWFNGARFNGRTGFGKASFASGAVFDRVIFTGDAGFGEATFEHGPSFLFAYARIRNRRRDHWPPGWDLTPATENPGMSRIVRLRPAMGGRAVLDESQGPDATP